MCARRTCRTRPKAFLRKVRSGLLEMLLDAGVTNVVALRSDAAIDAYGDIETHQLAEVVRELPTIVSWTDTAGTRGPNWPHLATFVPQALLPWSSVNVILLRRETREVLDANASVVTNDGKTVGKLRHVAVDRTTLRATPIVGDTGPRRARQGLLSHGLAGE